MGVSELRWSSSDGSAVVQGKIDGSEVDLHVLEWAGSHTATPNLAGI